MRWGNPLWLRRCACSSVRSWLFSDHWSCGVGEGVTDAGHPGIMWAEGSGELGGNHLDEPCSWQERMKLEGWARVVYFLLWWNTHNTWCFTGCSDGRVCLQCAKPGFDPWVGKIPWRRKYYPLQYPCPENPMDGGAWQATVHGVPKSWTRRSNFISHIALNHLNYLQMYSSVISSTFTLLCNQSLEFFRLANLKLRINPLSSDFPIPPPSSPWQPLLYFVWTWL